MTCKKYMYTATPSILDRLGYTLDYDNRKAPHGIKEIDIFLIKMERGKDEKIGKIALDKFNNQNTNLLAFLAEKRALDKLTNDNKNKSKYSGLKVITTIPEDDGMSVGSRMITFGDCTKFISRKENVTISYLNGTLSTGKNIGDADGLIMNGNPEINIRARSIIGENIKTFESKEDAALRVIIQACGRIERGDKPYKFIIIVGASEKLIEKYIEYKKENGIQYNLKVIDKDGRDYHISKALTYIENKIDNKQISYIDDERVKYDLDVREEVINYYLSMSADEKVDAKKLTMDKFGIKRTQFYEILKQHKCK